MYKNVLKIKGDAITMEKSDEFIIEDKKKTKMMAKQDLIKLQLGEKVLIEAFGKDSIEFLD